MVDTLDQLRALRTAAFAHGAENLFGLNHGNSWSVYFDDPEDNRVEIYVDTPFHTPQPCGEPLNLELSDEAIVAATAALVRTLPGSMSRDEYVAHIAEELTGH
jgi:catechol 2,3-dioxygenase